jgi:hypothetical protein
LGRWLRAFHDWTPRQANLAEEVSKNKEMQAVKHMINFEWLFRRIERFPSILAEAKDVFEQVKNMAAKELEDETKLRAIHGDFWSGKWV